MTLLFRHRSIQQTLNRICLSSLQLRLTVGVTAVSILGVGSITGWTIWRMQQILVMGHKEHLVDVAERVTQDVELYTEMMPMDEALHKAIDNRTTMNLVIWVKGPNQEVRAQSDALTTVAWERDGTTQELLNRAHQFSLPIVHKIRDRYLVICGGPMQIGETLLGNVYLAADITRDQTSLLAAIRILSVASLLGSLLIASMIALYIQRSLRPLRKLSQLAGDISDKNLGQTQLQIDQAPAEVRELAQAFNLMLSRLSMAWTQQRQFVSNVSHELRTPLTLVHGYLQSTLRRCQTLTEPQREGLEIAASEADRTIHLLQDLLDLARADGEYLRLHLETFDLKDLVLEILGMTQDFSDRVALEIEAVPLAITTDRERLKQVLINLLHNAVQYSEPDQPIQLKLYQDETWIVIRVCDRGKGIAPHHLVHLFEPFYRIDEDRSRATGGTGLGLSIVRTLVHRMGGTVGVHSTLGKGSIFTVTLPTSSTLQTGTYSP